MQIVPRGRVKLTANPELAVALDRGRRPECCFGSAPKAIVWLPCVTGKLWFTGVAAAQLALPVCVAWIVQVPTATSVTVAARRSCSLSRGRVKLTANPERRSRADGEGAVPKCCVRAAPRT